MKMSNEIDVIIEKDEKDTNTARNWDSADNQQN